MARAAAAPMPQAAAAAAGGQLPSPRSPALSCADMILPEPSLRSFSPSPYLERPPSPPHMYAQPDANHSTLHVDTNYSMAPITLAAAPKGRRDMSPHVRPSPPSSRSSQSTPRNGTDGSRSGRGTPQRIASMRNDTLASSPTIADGFTGQGPRTSNGSDSVHSDDLENITWLQFDGPGAFNDDSGVVLEEDEERNKRFSVITDSEGELDNERWLDEQNESDDKEENSAALSRRAEMILANAKKRLNVMEGNLRGARQSLVVSPTLGGTRAESALSFQLAASRERDRRLYAGQGPIPPRRQSYLSSPLAGNTSPGHARGMSETSVPAPLTPGYTSRISNKRASSALALSSGPWAPENYGQGRFPIRESRSWDTMADNRNGWGGSDERSSRSHESRGSGSPHNTLETLPEDDAGDPYLRPLSTTGDLKAQMQDLKGRISSLKLKAKEDTMRRRSLQTLRTGSPFTNAESWYSGADTYKSGGSPVTADAGVGIKTESPVRKTLYHEGSDGSLRSGGSSETVHNSNGQTQQRQEQRQEPVQSHKPAHNTLEDSYPEYNDQDSDDGSDSDFLSVIDDANSSVYEDAVYDFPVTERHEDRADAFDYEHFFLHSAMGTYSSGRRGSDSSSSGASSMDSVETTRPTTAVHEPSGDAAKRISMHQRNASVDSVSSVATFATAAEDFEEEEEEEEGGNEHMERFSEMLLGSQGQSQSQSQSQNQNQNQNQSQTQTQTHAYSQASSQYHSHQQQQHPQHPHPQPRSQSQYSRRPSPPQPVRPSTSHHTRPTTRSASALTHHTTSTSTSLRSTTSSPFPHASATTSSSRASSSPASDIASGLQTSKIYSILLGSRASPSEEPRLALSEEEKELVYALAASFQGVVGRLQGVGVATGGEYAGYERRELRRRLGAARRVLEGLDVLDVLNGDGDDEEGEGEGEDVF